MTSQSMLHILKRDKGHSVLLHQNETGDESCLGYEVVVSG